MIPSTEQHKAALDVAHDVYRDIQADPGDLTQRGALEAIISAYLSALPEQTGERWDPIETAPKDGTPVDLFHRESGRWTDCYWGMPPHECGEAGQYCDNDDWHGQEPRWVDGTFGQFISADGFTHWRHVPAPPIGEAP